MAKVTVSQSRVCLVSSDSICLLQTDARMAIYGTKRKAVRSSSSYSTLGWRHERCSAKYLSLNAPLRLASLSPEGRVAVAGKRGFCIAGAGYRPRWRVFGRIAEEQSFRVRCMDWVGPTRLVTAIGRQEDSISLILWDVHGSLSLDAIIGKCT